MPRPEDKEWRKPVWKKYPGHLPVKGRPWKDVVESTGKKHAKSKYGPHPEINEKIIKEIELAAVARNDNELPRPHDEVRAFWNDEGRIIGACCGHETQYVYVEYNKTRAVHGRPMTRELLIRRGMPR